MKTKYWAEQDNLDNNVIHIYQRTTMTMDEYRNYHDSLLIKPKVLSQRDSKLEDFIDRLDALEVPEQQD